MAENPKPVPMSPLLSAENRVVYNWAIQDCLPDPSDDLFEAKREGELFDETDETILTMAAGDTVAEEEIPNVTSTKS